MGVNYLALGKPPPKTTDCFKMTGEKFKAMALARVWTTEFEWCNFSPQGEPF